MQAINEDYQSVMGRAETGPGRGGGGSAHPIPTSSLTKTNVVVQMAM